ncbi:MAG TPA: chorismate-binding protein [Verrucomicrobium sp.]|nr:chorismate-binding protein [Verrucomicrobium sp.]
MMDLALFRLPDGRAWIGEGPFAEAAEPPPGDAFYVNDFALSSPTPWKIPSRLTALPAGDLPDGLTAGETLPRIVWQKPATEWFKMAFRRIRKDVLSQKLRKMVPVLTESGTLVGVNGQGNLAALLNRVMGAPQGLWGYGRIEGGKGFLGATPELLLRKNGLRLETMALAGTAKPNGRDSFGTDAKEIEEHELVANFLQDALAPLGKVSKGDRQISEAAGLTHFRTQVAVDLEENASLDSLVRRLHPTPAVGCLPRDQISLEKLTEYRRQLDAPAYFGAPFGLKVGDTFEAVVSIRGIGWDGEKVMLSSGCGIVGGSAFDHEWRELRLKRESVARLLGI